MKLLRISTDKNYIFIPEFIWDGISDTLLHEHVVSIKNGVINYLGPAENVCSILQDDTEILRLAGTTLIPGLVDCHVHLAMNCNDLYKAVGDWESLPEQTITQAESYLEDYLRNGVVAVRDGGDKANIGLKMRKLEKQEKLAAPVITATGRAIYKKGMYGSFLGPGVSCINEAFKQVEDFKATGADQLKIVVSGLVSFKKFGAVGSVQFSAEELKEIIEKAHSLGLKVMAHASSAPAVEISVLAGADSIEHGYFLERHQLELMAEHKTAWVPTLAPLGNLIRENLITYQGADPDIIKKSFERQLVMVNEAFQMGVILGIGTDAGANQVFHGYSYHDELGYYSAAGLDNLAILKSATSVSARIISKDTSVGIISEGKQPFWCCISGNPLKKLETLKSPEAVIIPDCINA